MPITVIWCVGKIGSFGFACVSACAVGAKPNVPMCDGLNFKIFCAVGKKIKHGRVGNECRLTRCPFFVSFLCLWSPVKMVYFFLV